MDLPEVLPVFEERARELGLHTRVSCLPGDYKTTTIPEDSFDMVVLGNVLHLETDEAASRLVANCARALHDEGRLVVVDALSDGPLNFRGVLSAYRLSLALRTKSGQPHSGAQICSWMSNAGLVDTHTYEATPPVSYLVGRLRGRAAAG
jgi:SAM-dependent methyltransferase